MTSTLKSPISVKDLEAILNILGPATTAKLSAHNGDYSSLLAQIEKVYPKNEEPLKKEGLSINRKSIVKVGYPKSESLLKIYSHCLDRIEGYKGEIPCNFRLKELGERELLSLELNNIYWATLDGEHKYTISATLNLLYPAGIELNYRDAKNSEYGQRILTSPEPVKKLFEAIQIMPLELTFNNKQKSL